MALSPQIEGVPGLTGVKYTKGILHTRRYTGKNQYYLLERSLNSQLSNKRENTRREHVIDYKYKRRTRELYRTKYGWSLKSSRKMGCKLQGRRLII